jgi:hypothetical protein
MSVFDLIGMAGIGLNLFGYFLIQNQTLRPVDGRFACIQITSCVLLLLSLSHTFNLSSALLNIIVIAFTVYGHVKFRLKRKTISATEAE